MASMLRGYASREDSHLMQAAFLFTSEEISWRLTCPQPYISMTSKPELLRISMAHPPKKGTTWSVVMTSRGPVLTSLAP